MAFVTQPETLALVKQGKVWRAHHEWSLAASAHIDFGFVVGARDMVALTREYITQSSGILVSLHEASFTGGTDVKTINRRLSFSGNPKPIQFKAGVTPGALGDRITGFEMESSGPIRIGRQGDNEPFIHDAGKSYVLRIQNTGNATHDFSFAVDYREKIPWEY